MILNGSALLCGLFCVSKGLSSRNSLRKWIVIGALFGALFVTSVFAVNYLRSANWAIALGEESASMEESFNLPAARTSAAILFLDRWVGIEGVLAVSSSPERGWELFSRAWGEDYSKNLSFFDTHLITSPYATTDMTRVRHVSLPGGIAFFYYPGSLPFLFFSLLVLGLIGGGLEWAVFKFGGGNLILCALLSQVVAYRFSHFGYLPKDSHLLFGALVLNVILIAFANYILTWWYSDSRRSETLNE